MSLVSLVSLVSLACVPCVPCVQDGRGARVWGCVGGCGVSCAYFWRRTSLSFSRLASLSFLSFAIMLACFAVFFHPVSPRVYFGIACPFLSFGWDVAVACVVRRYRGPRGPRSVLSGRYPFCPFVVRFVRSLSLLSGRCPFYPFCPLVVRSVVRFVHSFFCLSVLSARCPFVWFVCLVRSLSICRVVPPARGGVLTEVHLRREY